MFLIPKTRMGACMPCLYVYNIVMAMIKWGYDDGAMVIYMGPGALTYLTRQMINCNASGES